MRLLLIPLLAASCTCAPLFGADDDGYTDGKAGWGAHAIPVPLSVQAKLDLAPGEGVVILRVRPGGTADKLGLERGDVVLALNDRPVSNRRDIRGVMSTVAPGDQAEVLTRRGNGSTTELTGTFQARQPRPPRPAGGWGGFGGPGGPGGPGGWGGPPPDEDPDTQAARQYGELLSEQRQLAETASELLALRSDMAAGPTGNWYLHVAIGDTP